MTKRDIMSIALLISTVLLMTAKTLSKCDFVKNALGIEDDPLELPDIPDFYDEF